MASKFLIFEIKKENACMKLNNRTR